MDERRTLTTLIQTRTLTLFANLTSDPYKQHG